MYIIIASKLERHLYRLAPSCGKCITQLALEDVANLKYVIFLNEAKDRNIANFH